MNAGNTRSGVGGALGTPNDPFHKVRRRVEDRLSLEAGKRVRVGSAADHLIVSIRDEMVARVSQGEKMAILELELLLEESSTELDEFRKAFA